MQTSAKTVFLLGLFIVGCGEVKSQHGDGPPSGDPPTGVTAVANIDHGARLSWTAPAGPATGYTVTATPAGGTVKVVGTAALVTGLTEGQRYTFTVTAMTAAGPSRESDPSNAVNVVAGPPAPDGFVACGADRQVSIRANAAPGMASFKVYFDAAPGVSKLSTTMMAAPALPLTVPGLNNGEKRFYVAAVVDANGIESLDSAEDSATPDSAIHDTVFGHSYSGIQQSIEIIDCLSKIPSNTTAPSPARLIKGANAGIVTSNYNQIAVDPAKALIYYRNPAAILVFADATRADGNVAPLRTITGAGTGLTGGIGIAIDTTRDLLYVLNGSNAILVFAGASTASGNVAPIRTITSANALTGGHALSLDAAGDRLYVSNNVNALVFKSASTANGDTAPAQTISIAGAALTSYGVAVDPANDLLYIGSRNGLAIYSVPASTATGAVNPLRTITGLNVPMGVALVQNRLFMMSDNNANQLFGWTSANTRNGAVAADLVIKFPTLIATAGFAYAP